MAVGMQQPFSTNNGSKPIADADLAIEASDVPPHGLVSNAEALGDLTVRETLRDQPQDVRLPASQGSWAKLN